MTIFVQKDRQSIELLVAVVGYKTILKAPRKGVATSWLAGLQPGSRLSVEIVNGSMRLPLDPLLPVVLIGPGTGIAPFRSFVQERLRLNPKSNNTLVFFGCRSATKDFYFAEDWKHAEREGNIKFVLAASRDQEDKVYVQHKLLEEAELVWQYIGEQRGIVYVSG